MRKLSTTCRAARASRPIQFDYTPIQHAIKNTKAQKARSVQLVVGVGWFLDPVAYVEHGYKKQRFHLPPMLTLASFFGNHTLLKYRKIHSAPKASLADGVDKDLEPSACMA